MTLYINHVGYTPAASKLCVMGGTWETEFAVCDATSGAEVYRGMLRRAASDYGLYTRGDFSALSTPGTYVVRAGREQSQPFTVAQDVYADALQKMVGYFQLQRCGATDTGWNGPCHLDDGLRGDTLQHQVVEGGWHDACDLRKWVDATLYGMVGLAWLKNTAACQWDDGCIEDELRWGNRYFLSMQEPAGYVMNFIGGDYFAHADNNRWTDNIGDRVDDRLIDVRPCTTNAQWVFIFAQAALMQLTNDAAYAAQCERAARACLRWLLAGEYTHTAGELGAALVALTALHRATGDATLPGVAVGYAETLLKMQVLRQVDSRSEVWGFFWDRLDVAPSAREPFKSIWQGCWPLIGLAELLAAAPDHPRAPAWRDAITLYVDRYLRPLAARSAFGTVPYGLYRGTPPGSRDLGRFSYRWFMEARPDWYVGINAHLASTGLGLMRAAQLLDRPDYAAMAQRQLDWIVGFNPFNASTVVDVGYNVPQHMLGAEFYPPTPYLPGAVMNGISGTAEDVPQLRPGSWQETEYWTPMAGFTMALLAELGAS